MNIEDFKKSDYCEILYYNTTIDMELICRCRKKIINSNIGRKLSKKVFSILIEMTQNIYKYSEYKKNEIGVGEIGVYIKNNNIIIVSRNLIKNDNVLNIKNYCNDINNSSLEKLRELKIKQWGIKNSIQSAKIGLIKISTISKNKLSYNFQNYDDDYSLYTLISTINF